jgi:hypothetical protein
MKRNARRTVLINKAEVAEPARFFIQQQKEYFLRQAYVEQPHAS